MLSILAMHVLQSGQTAGFGIPCLFTKEICLIFESKNESASSARCFGS